MNSAQVSVVVITSVIVVSAGQATTLILNALKDVRLSSIVIKTTRSTCPIAITLIGCNPICLIIVGVDGISLVLDGSIQSVPAIAPVSNALENSLEWSILLEVITVFMTPHITISYNIIVG